MTMPYPIAHVMFFVLCISAAMTYVTLGAVFRKEITPTNMLNVIILLFVGGIAALFPDVTAVYNILVNGTIEHVNLGPIPTHSILFSSLAFFMGIGIGYVVYRKYDKAIYMGIFAESASLSHLLLDDLARYEIDYFYPLYNTPISIFSYVDSSISRGSFLHYLLACYISIMLLFVVIMMALFALEHLGFEFRFRPKNE